MKLDLFDALVDVDVHRTVALPDAFAVGVACAHGCLWVTEDRLRGDRVQRPGESRCIRCNGRALVAPAARRDPGAGAR